MPRRSPPRLAPSLRRFLATPRLARLCTIGPDGYPHVVPIYLARAGDALIFGTDHHEAKVRKALRNPRSAIVLAGDPGHLEGVRREAGT
jgi:nitroimidazol reductase NimA-like FMN-containing flavoprotein (pyridoxamine 5'-phosphate oxidase superfamily)